MRLPNLPHSPPRRHGIGFWELVSWLAVLAIFGPLLASFIAGNLP